MYPYMLECNPFPASTVARRDNAVFLGGRRWKIARNKIKENILKADVQISVIIGPYGVGKTHLVFNLLNFFEDKGFITSYTELSGLASGENPVIKAISHLLDAFFEFREEIVRGAIKKLDGEGMLNKVLNLNFSRFGAWRMRKKLNRYLNRDENVRLSYTEKMFFRDTVLTMLEEMGVDRRMTKVLLFSYSWKNILQTMDSAVSALSAMADVLRITGKDRIVIAFDELDILEQKSSPHDITEPFRNLINNLPTNVHVILAITRTAMDRVQTIDPGLYRRLDDKSKVCIVFLENPDNEEELFEIIRDILEDAGAEMDIRGEKELRNLCKVVFDKKKERPLSESLTLFNTLFEMVKGKGTNIERACELLGVSLISREQIVEQPKEIENAIRNLCFRLKEAGYIRKVHERGKRINLKSGGWRVADIFFEDNDGKWVAGEVKVRNEFLGASNLYIPEIMREGFFKEGGERKRVDRAIIWYIATGLSDEVEREIEKLRGEGKILDIVKLSGEEVMVLKEAKDLETEGRRLMII